MVVVARKAAAVFARVIRRFLISDDHGVYPTVVEEILREFYVANAGAAVWTAMKNETSDTFVGTGRGGRLLVDGIAEALTGNAQVDITLVGHSTGAVYIDNLLSELVKGRAEGYRIWPDDQKIRVILLAPAATYERFTAGVENYENLISEMRVITMTDESEQADQLLGPAYPRSLLYFVSGVVERDRDGKSGVMPLIGMARYRASSYSNRTDLAAGRKFLTDERVILSPSPLDAPLGRRAGALSHGAFDDDPLVLESIAYLLENVP
ncbi:hypothetical protein OUO20_05535 [Arthrobacter sp. FX8]|uniref:hypothetical protein n=1 Tax=Arthrobacter sp. FX8 TaxID=2997335 RepID=UPI00227C563A|nr:hypothetical protein [Arthrobacter sp. FX8]WAJ34397.1 hypothetical protein OUO20_05535 [Arthrobacter sp. FX8]